MAEHEDTGAALRRLEAALNRIAAQVAKPRSTFVIPDQPNRAAAADESQDAVPNREAASQAGPSRHEIVTKLDDLIGGLRTALGIERQS
jgi:hypothetical protein